MTNKERIRKTLTNNKKQFIVETIGRMKQAIVAKKVEEKTDVFYHGYEYYIDSLAKYLPEDKNAVIGVLDDYGLQLIDAYEKLGYKNIVLISSEMSSDLYVKIVYIIEHVFRRKINVVNIKEIEGMTFDTIIANPPFEIGNNITAYLVENVNFITYVNLLPLSKYKAGDLFMHVIPESIKHSTTTVAFGDGAYTTPELCCLSKKTFIEEYDIFELEAIYDQRLEKFWKEQLRRKPTYTKHMYMIHTKDFPNISSKTSFSCGIYTPNIMLSNGPKTLKNSDGSFKVDDRHYIWNFIKPEGTIDQYFEPTAGGSVINQIATIFATEQEADNFKKWAHSGELSGKGRLLGLFSILLRGMNKPTGCPFPYAIPRVDWSRPWTDEEILADYGYSKEEIETILHFNDDLIKE